MTRSKLLAFFLNVVLVLSFVSCNLFVQPDEKNPDKSSGSLVVVFKETAKTLLPEGDLALSSLDLVLTKTGSITIERNGLVATTTSIDPIILQIGTWTVTVNGRNAAGQLIACGSDVAVIKPAASTSVSITVKPLVGNGILSLTATIGAGVARNPSISGKLEPVGGGTAINFDMTVASGGASASYVNTAIPAGFYSLTISISDDGTVVARSEPEAVQIAEGRRTTGPISFVFDPGLGRVVVSITISMDEPITITLSGLQSSIHINQSMTVSASTSEPVTLYRWYLNNVEVAGERGSSLLINGSIGIGNHRLGLVVSTLTKVSSKTAFFAVTPIPTYKVTYDGNGQTTGTVPTDSNEYQEGQSVPILGNIGSLTKTGLWFTGWNSKADGSGTDYTPLTTFSMGSANTTLYAKWTVHPKYTVNFDTKGGTAVSSVFTNLISDFPVSSKTGYALEGWFLDDTYAADKKISFPYSPESNTTLVAKWITATVGLQYNWDGSGYGVSKGSANTIGSVVIPEYWLGNRVTAIWYKAFYGCSSLLSVTIPSSVTSIVDNAFYGCSNLTSVSIPNSVTSIGSDAFRGCSRLTSMTIPNGVTSIADNAFYGCSSLTSVTIPNSVTSIGNEAFSGCSRLTNMTIPNSVTSIGNGAFAFCSSLSSVTIPSSVTSIADNAFYLCSNLTSVTIPNSITIIGSDSFRGCSRLTSMIISNRVTSIGNGAFAFCYSLTSVIIPSSVTYLGDQAFYNCSSLTSITIPSSVTSIGNEAFMFCGSLTNVTIPNSVTSIRDYAFHGCSSLTSVAIPNSVTSIGDHAFATCNSLTSVTIPGSVISIGDWAFSSCSNLASVTILSGVTSIGDYTFYSCSNLTNVTIPSSVTSIGDYTFASCSSLTSVTIPNSVTFIGDYSFTSCSSLTSVSIPNSVTFIGDYTFASCSSLTSVIIPNSVTFIGDYTFASCSSLTSISIPNSVTFIGDYTFRSCITLGIVIVNSEVPPNTGISVFESCSGLSAIKVPSSSVATYKSALGWSDYASLIVSQ